MILLIDNYDSFSYNLYQMVGEITPDIKVIRNDEMTVEQIQKMDPDHIIISPGPGRCENAGIIIDAAKTICQRIPTLGVCLGHQAICAAYGAEITYADHLMHGKQSVARVDVSCEIFRGLDNSFPVGRYHSLSVKKDTVPDCLKITAWTDEDEIMAVRHVKYPIFGLQFHPESILTPNGKLILRNFISC